MGSNEDYPRGGHPLSRRGQTIQIFLPNQDAAGLRIAAIPTRTVQVFDIPRSLLSDFLTRKESSRPAVYYLFGVNDHDEPIVYIGQSNNVGDRLRTHHRIRAKWDRAIVAISLTNEWSQTHISYLEWEAIHLARDAGRYIVDNANAGTQPHTPDPLRADCAEYMATIRQLLSTLGFPVMERARKPKQNDVHSGGWGIEDIAEDTDPEVPISPEEEPDGSANDSVVKVYLDGRGVKASGMYSSDGLLILAGSQGVRSDFTSNVHRHSLINAIDDLAKVGTVRISEDKKSYTFISDYQCRTPSGAASLLTCSRRNGRSDFKDASGKSILDIDAERVDQSQQAAMNAPRKENQERRHEA